MGIPERYDLPDFDLAVIDIITRARQTGVGAGIHVTTGAGLNTEDEIRWIRAGANLIVPRADIIAVQHHLTRELGEIRAAVGDARDRGGDADLNI